MLNKIKSAPGRKKTTFSILALVLGISLVFYPYAIVKGQEAFVTDRKIVIDAGHGGRDPGSTQCPGLYESVANFQIAELLQAMLMDAGATVYMTRDMDGNGEDDLADDETLTNADRYTYANSTNSDVLLSIHLNGSLDHTKNGTLGLYSMWRKDKEFASILHERLADELNVPDLGIYQFMSGVTMRFNGPASIQESVYISNTEECTALTDGTGNRQQQIAESLYNGLNDWFSAEREVFISPGQLK
ncbi:N-acetylmuramoyl-L-alanine amidase [Patescibacteria group bacterium]|nr:N-acetylmuramoyl-L-alanine amidase [Patescibacteria group bacterium]